MNRRLCIAGASVSMILCLMTLFVWVRSHWTADAVWISVPGHLCVAESSAGSIGVLRFREMCSEGWGVEHVTFEPRGMLAQLMTPSFAGFGWANSTVATVAFDGPVVPLWFLAALFAIGPVALITLGFRDRRVSGCPACGYDLRGSEGATCPECGASRLHRSIKSSTATAEDRAHKSDT